MRTPCTQWTTPKDTDGIQLCPASNQGPWGIYNCAFYAARTWVPPKPAQKVAMSNLMRALKAKDSAGILNYADQLNLRVCREKKPMPPIRLPIAIWYCPQSQVSQTIRGHLSFIAK